MSRRDDLRGEYQKRSDDGGRRDESSYQKKIVASRFDLDAENLLRRRAKGQDVLFHGTRYAEAIIGENLLKYARTGDPVVSFTRLPEVAVYWARLERGEVFETANILMVNRKLLKSDYNVFPHHDPIFDNESRMNFEAEERIEMRDIDDLERYLVGVVTLQFKKRRYFG